jgi:hypothetical protein
MANFDATTASNGAKIKDGTKEAVEAIIDKYIFNELTVQISDKYLEVYGYDWLNVGKDGEDEDDMDFAQEFLEEIAPFLAEPLIIQCVGAEKCRFPLSAMEVKVNPDGIIEWNQFKFN